MALLKTIDSLAARQPARELPMVNYPTKTHMGLMNNTAAIIQQICTNSMRIGAQNRAAIKAFGVLGGGNCHVNLMNNEARCSCCRAIEAIKTGKPTMAKVPLPNNRWILLMWTPAPELGSSCVTETIIDITESEAEKTGYLEQIDTLDEQATTDVLTKLMNRHSWFYYAERQVVQSIKKQEPVELLLVDIDHFKKINDTYSHLVGDDAIRHLGAMLRNGTRETDFVGRYGGEEFIVLLNPTTGDPTVMAERLRTLVEATPLSVEGVPHPIPMTISVGVAAGQLTGTVIGALDGLIKEADHALYASKRNGRNRVTLAGTAAATIHNAPTLFSRTRTYVRNFFTPQAA